MTRTRLARHVVVFGLAAFMIGAKCDDGIRRNRTVVLRDGRVLTGCAIYLHVDDTTLVCNEGRFERVDNYEVKP